MTIRYTEKGSRLHEAIRAAGHWLREENGEWVSSDDAAVQAIIDSFDPVAAELPQKIASVKEEAQRRIFAVMPAHKQTNLLALATENMLAHGPDSSKWPADIQAVKAVADAGWAKIKAIRAASNEIEARLSAEPDWQKIEAHEAATDDAWPK